MAYAMMRRAVSYGLLCCAAGCVAHSPLQPSYVAAPTEFSRDGVIRITDTAGYLSYHAPTPKDFPNYRYVQRVRGEVCQNDLQLPLHLQGGHAQSTLDHAKTLEFLWGDATVASAMADALNGAPPTAVLYDLALDVHQTSVFGVFFRRKCLVLSGSLAMPQPAGILGPQTVERVVPAPAARAAEPEAATQGGDGIVPMPALEPPPTQGTTAPSQPAGHGDSDSEAPRGRSKHRTGPHKHQDSHGRHSGRHHKKR